MIYSLDLAKRFVNDYKLPISMLGEPEFYYYVGLYEKDFGSTTTYMKLIETINNRYAGQIKLFLQDYYNTRERVIQAVIQNPDYQEFNNMDMNCFAIKNKPNITSNNIYNQENVGHFFISVDMKKANFQALKKVNKGILFDAETYEEFISKFTNLDYIKESKYFREVIFGQMNPKRHITVEKYYINEIYKKICDKIRELDGRAVSISNDEIIFKADHLLYCENDKVVTKKLDELYEGGIINTIKSIAQEIGFEVDVEPFMLEGYKLVAEGNNEFSKVFYKKKYPENITKFKLIGIPLQFHAIAYELYNKTTPFKCDYHFMYEGLECTFTDTFLLKKIEKTEDTREIRCCDEEDFEEKLNRNYKKSLCDRMEILREENGFIYKT